MKQNNLSAWKYIKNNKRKVVVLMIAISLSFMAMYVVKFLFCATTESFKPILMEYPKHVMFVELTPQTMGIDREQYESEEEYEEANHKRQNEIAEQLKNVDGVDDVYYSQLLGAHYNAILGQMSYKFPLFDNSAKIPGYLEHMGAKLVDGRLPENDGEILVDEIIMTNNKLEIGGNFFENSYGETFKVVGTVESDCLVCVGKPNGGTNWGYAFVIYCNEENCNAKELFEKIGITLSDNDQITDSEAGLKTYKEDVEAQLGSSLALIIVVIVIFLAVSIVVAYVSFLRNRLEEYCLYMSIGYSKSAIYGMIMREILLIFGISIIAGLLVIVATTKLLALFLFDPKGIMYRYFYPEHLAVVFAAYTAIIGVLQIPIVISINGIKTIDKLDMI